MGDSICSIIQQRHASLDIFFSSPANTVHDEPRIAQKRRMALFASLDMKGAATLFNHSFLRIYGQGLVILTDNVCTWDLMVCRVCHRHRQRACRKRT